MSVLPSRYTQGAAQSLPKGCVSVLPIRYAQGTAQSLAKELKDRRERHGLPRFTFQAAAVGAQR
jgi:hypothetical protein